MRNLTLPMQGGRTTIGDVVKKQKRNSMVEISSDEEDQRGMRINLAGRSCSDV